MCLCPPRVYFPVLCKFRQLYGGVNGVLLQEGLCHTQVCCTQISCPYGSPVLTLYLLRRRSLSVWSLGPWCTQGLFEPSEHLWWEWGLIVNVNSPLLPSCWGFPFALCKYIQLIFKSFLLMRKSSPSYLHPSLFCPCPGFRLKSGSSPNYSTTFKKITGTHLSEWISSKREQITSVGEDVEEK